MSSGGGGLKWARRLVHQKVMKNVNIDSRKVPGLLRQGKDRLDMLPTA